MWRDSFARLYVPHRKVRFIINLLVIFALLHVDLQIDCWWVRRTMGFSVNSASNGETWHRGTESEEFSKGVEHRRSSRFEPNPDGLRSAKQGIEVDDDPIGDVELLQWLNVKRPHGCTRDAMDVGTKEKSHLSTPKGLSNSLSRLVFVDSGGKGSSTSVAVASREPTGRLHSRRYQRSGCQRTYGSAAVVSYQERRAMRTRKRGTR